MKNSSAEWPRAAASGAPATAQPARASQFMRNCWYAAAFAEEICTNQAMARIFLGERIAFFRDSKGRPVALFDRCAHRFAPLHGGVVQGDVIECPYHGLRYDRTGACVHNPHGNGAIPKRAVVRSYPLVERFGLVWIWLGDGENPDETLIPDLGVLESAEPNAVAKGYMYTKANYELVTDNLMDLSHADYIHKASLNTGGCLSRLQPEVRTTDDMVRVYWEYQTDHVQPFFRSTMQNPDGPAIQSFSMTWRPPSNMLLAVTARDADRSPEANATYTTAHLLTPETETSCHYFTIGIRTWDLSNAELNQALTVGLMGAFLNEDKPALEAVQDSMQTTDLWSLEPILLSCDPGPVHARRMLKRKIDAENARAGERLSE